MADASDIEVVHNEGEGRFEARLGDQVAFTQYRVLQNGILFPHTEVPEAFEGQGVGGKLVEAAMRWARERDAKVMPVCTFVAGYIRRHPEHHDLVHDDYRRALGL